MKKFYILMSAACVAATAFAVENHKVAQVKKSSPVRESVQSIADPVKAVQAAEIKASSEASKVIKKADGTDGFVYFLPDDNIMSIGMNPEGRRYTGLGFASSYGSLNFYNLSTKVESTTWNFANLGDYEIEEDQQVWNYQTSTDQNLSIKSGIGEVMPPILYAGSDEESAYQLPVTKIYCCGGSAQYWGASDYGLTFYQNVGLKNDRGYDGGSTYKLSYSIGDDLYNENGVYTEWESAIQEKYPNASSISNIKLNNFSIIQPKPASTYFMTQGWIWMNVSATAATQLISYIYPITEEGLSDTPIAIGYATVAEGDTRYQTFEYYPINEDGDEMEGDVFVDSAVLITIEGFAGNEAITDVSPVSGYYPFSKAEYKSGNKDIVKSTDMMMNFSFDVDGTPVTELLVDTGLYYFNDMNVDGDTLSALSYAMFCTNATYAFIVAANGEESVHIDEAGGSVDVEIDALYYKVAEWVEAGYYEVTAPDWLTVTFSKADKQTYLTTMTVTAEASEEGRTGVVSINGIGATFDLTVVQGDGGAGVDVVVSDKDAVYYDLAGRRVMNPDKGIYIKKVGNKAEKVIR